MLLFQKPLIKKPDGGCELKNYRPVSNLPFISKIIEKVIVEQLTNYKSDNNLGEELQSAYKKGHSTETALLKVYDNILQQMDNQQVVLLMLLDLSAAFDTVDHTILLNRLEKSFGITGKALAWIRSYLTNRSQYVSINGSKSHSVKLDCCVPQGSLLGAGFYCDYSSPIGRLILLLLLLFHCYADDTQLTESVNPNDVQQMAVKKMESSFTEINSWMHDNKLKLNGDKTEFMVIGSSRQRKKMKVDRLQLSQDVVHEVKCVGNLGVQTDNEMNMDAHVSHLVKSFFIRLAIFVELENILHLKQQRN